MDYQTIIITICNIACTFWGYMRGIALYLMQSFSAIGNRFTFSYILYDGSAKVVSLPEIPAIADIVDAIARLLGTINVDFTILSILITTTLTTFIVTKLVKVIF